MKWLDDLQIFLSGKKTYLMAAGYALDTYGVQMGWWESANFRAVMEQVMLVVFLRQGVVKSGPAEAKSGPAEVK